MERVENQDAALAALLAEHNHRYMFAAKYATGHVVDCACGIGYGHAFFQGNQVATYLGLDPDESAIAAARSQPVSANVSFDCRTIEQPRLERGMVDTFVCLETLEHCVDPELGIRSVSDCLHPNGLFIGSVPSVEYETLCEQTYGANPFHLQRFAYADLRKLLKKRFSNVQLFLACFSTATFIAPLAEGFDERQQDYSVSGFRPENFQGSLMWLCSNRSVDANASDLRGTVFLGPPKVIVDQQENLPLRSTIKDQQNSLDLRWQIMAKQDDRIASLEAANQSQAAAIDARDVALREQSRVLDERWKILSQQSARIESLEAENKSQAAIVDARDSAIVEQTRLLDERWLLMSQQSARIESLEAENKSQAAIVDARDSAIVKQTRLLDERWQLMSQQSARIESLEAENKSQAAIVDERDGAIAKQVRLLDERWLLMSQQTARIESLEAANRSQAAIVDARDKTLAAQARLLDERWAVMAQQDQRIASLDAAISSQTDMIDSRDKVIAEQVQLIENRWQIMSEQGVRIASLEEANQALATVVDSRDKSIAGLNSDLRLVTAALSELRSTRGVRLLQRLHVIKP